MSTKRTLSYLSILIIYIGVMYNECMQIPNISKYWVVLIMPSIGLAFILNNTGADSLIKKLMLGAFLFSWLGDLILMQAGKMQLFFYIGLLAFLAAHVFYILSFIQLNKKSGGQIFLRRKPQWVIPYVAVLLAFVLGIDPLLLSCILFYTITILTMSLMSLNRLGKCKLSSFIPVFIGTILFVVSDSIIGVNQFITVIPHSGCLIMGTYIPAQFFIMEGVQRGQTA